MVTSCKNVASYKGTELCKTYHFWLFQRIPLGDVLSKRVQSATASGGVRCGKHAIGTPNDGTAFVMNSKGS
jgi:hypothetical protein